MAFGVDVLLACKKQDRVWPTFSVAAQSCRTKGTRLRRRSGTTDENPLELWLFTPPAVGYSHAHREVAQIP
jgi:hypothetical protein